MRMSVAFLSAAVAALAGAFTAAGAQEIDVMVADQIEEPSDGGLMAETGDGLADPYPLGDAEQTPSELPLSPAVPPVLRPSIGEVAPLRSVVRPVQRTPAALPVTGSIPLPIDREGDARAAYEPQGLRFGSFDLRATTRSAIGASSESGAYWRNDTDVAVRSDWERHSVGLTLRGGLVDYERSGEASSPSAGARIDGALDLTEVDRVGATAGYSWSREDSDSAELGAGASPSDIHVISGALGYDRTAGVIGVSLKGAVDHSIYTESADRTNTAYSLSLRTTLDTGAVIRPFAEAAGFARRYENEVDSSGFRRNSVGGELKGGILVDTGLVSGELAAGYAVEDLEDDRLARIDGFIGEARLVWAPTRLTTITLTGDTSFAPTQLSGSSGSVTRTVDLSLAYALRPNIILDAGLTYSQQDYAGSDQRVRTSRIRGGAAWKLNPTVEVGVTASHEITDSTEPGDDQRDSRIEAAVTLRR